MVDFAATFWKMCIRDSGLTEQLPEGQRLKFVVGRADDLQPVIMGLDIPQKPAERIVEEKPHRQAGGIGRQAQDVKVHAGVQLDVYKRQSLYPSARLAIYHPYRCDFGCRNGTEAGTDRHLPILYRYTDG